MKHAHIHLLTALLLLTTATGCSDSGRHDGSPADTPADSMAVRITVSMPQRQPERSRSMTDADESTVDDLLVMLFTPDENSLPATLYRVVPASSIQDNTTTENPTTDNLTPPTRYSFDLRIGVDPATTPASLAVVTVANAASRAADISAGMTYGQVQAALTADAPGQSDTRLTMWGIASTLVDTSLRAQGLSITLLRDRARVTFGVDTDKVPASLFSPASMQVMKASSRMLLIPSIENVSGNVATAPSLPTDNPTTDNLSTSCDLTAASPRLYLAEADIRMGGNGEPDDENRLNRAAIIVGGSYRGATQPCYYRVDFKGADGMLIDVLRNHSYNITVTAVNGPGEPTPEEAYHSIVTSIDATITEWEDINNDVAFDGANWIAMPRTAVIGPEKGAEATLSLSTNVDPALWETFWATEGDADIFSVTLPATLDENGAGTLTVKALTALPEDTDSRTAQLQIHVTPRLRLIVNIIQQRTGSGDRDHSDWTDGGNIPGQV